MLTSINYGYKNLVYDGNIGKITWVNNLYVIGQGELATPSATTVVYRDDLGGSQEAINEQGIPLPIDTVLCAEIISVASVLNVEYHIHPISGVPTETDTFVYVAWNRIGDVSNKYSQPWNYETRIANEAKEYADSIRRTDQEIIDLVTDAGLEIADYEERLAGRINKIVETAMGNDSVTEAIDKMFKSWENMQLSGDKLAQLQADFYNQLTTTTINNAVQTASQSMLTEEQVNLTKRQTKGFDDNLLVKANTAYGNTIALINSGSSNATPANWDKFDQTTEELVRRSKGEDAEDS